MFEEEESDDEEPQNNQQKNQGDILRFDFKRNFPPRRKYGLPASTTQAPDITTELPETTTYNVSVKQNPVF